MLMEICESVFFAATLPYIVGDIGTLDKTPTAPLTTSGSDYILVWSISNSCFPKTDSSDKCQCVPFNRIDTARYQVLKGVAFDI